MFKPQIIRRTKRKKLCQKNVGVMTYRNPHVSDSGSSDSRDVENALRRNPNFCLYRKFEMKEEDLRERGYIPNGSEEGNCSYGLMDRYHPLPHLSLFLHTSGASLLYESDRYDRSQMIITGVTDSVKACSKEIDSFLKEFHGR